MAYARMTFVVADRVAAAAYRKAARAPLDATPLGDRQRTVAASLGLVRGPVLVGLSAAAFLRWLGEFTTGATSDPVYQRAVLEYLQLPALVLGAGLLGVAVSRWLPRPGALPLIAVALWIGTLAMYQPTAETRLHGSTGFALWPVWLAAPQGELPRHRCARRYGTRWPRLRV